LQYRFGAFHLDLDRAVLRHAGRDLPLRRKAFLVLAYLVRHHDRLVSREELRAAAWPDVHVSDTTLATTVHELRRALAECDPAANAFRTVHGRGYRFALPVEFVGAARERKPIRTASAERLLARLRGSGRLEHLPRLDREETAALVAAVAGWVPKDDVVAAVHARTGGWPLFVLELAGLLREVLLEQAGQAWPDARAVP
jgi:DNA-binding winged helix-turn-helix (wHTH) protein